MDARERERLERLRLPAPARAITLEADRLLVYETGVHWIDTFRFLLGEIETVYAQLQQRNPAIRGEDSGQLIFSHAGGATVSAVLAAMGAPREAAVGTLRRRPVRLLLLDPEVLHVEERRIVGVNALGRGGRDVAGGHRPGAQRGCAAHAVGLARLAGPRTRPCQALAGATTEGQQQALQPACSGGGMHQQGQGAQAL